MKRVKAWSRIGAWLLVVASLNGCLFIADEIEPVTKANLAADSPRALFDLLQQAYQMRSITTLDQILADDYQFVADAASLANSSENSWGKDVEMERHSRMFQAIQNVNCVIKTDGLSPHPELAPRETTWTVFSLEMTLDYDGSYYEVRGQADFRLRAEALPDGSSLYKIVRWTDRP